MIYIKDMDMPVDCLGCRISCKHESYLVIGRPEDCPLEEAKTGDLISRADAIEAICMNDCGGCRPNECGAYLDKSCDVVKVLSALPSAEAEPKMTEEVREALMRLTMCAREECGMCKYKDECGFDLQYKISTENMNTILDAFISAEAVQEWIPFTRRPMTEEEQKDYPNCTFMFDCVLPDDGDEILVSNRRFVWMDVFCSDVDGCYLDGGDDIDEDMAWMPLPEPYKGGEDE